MRITEKEIKETELKTYAYLSTLLSGFFGTGALLNIGNFAFSLNEYLTYHNNPDDNGGKLHYVDLNDIWITGISGIILAVLFILVVAYRVQKIKKLEKKVRVYIFSFLTEIFFMVVWGYIIVCFWK
ncbi:MAG: hypothetical protein NC177_04770 [Ruminococcus flavefaciens]|nr:hypothetical protein [Ruminococcus flavefaciens]